jgi:hypothetical protein
VPRREVRAPGLDWRRPIGSTTLCFGEALADCRDPAGGDDAGSRGDKGRPSEGRPGVEVSPTPVETAPDGNPKRAATVGPT